MRISKSHFVCLLAGAVVGIGGSFFFVESKPLKAATTDRTSKFAVATVAADFNGESEGVFVLDFLNGTLTGGVINNQTGKYTHRYFRQISLDFKVAPNTPEPEYAIVGTRSNLRGNGASKGVIHVAEKSSGAIIAYGFALPNRADPRVPLPMQLLDFIQFREATN